MSASNEDSPIFDSEAAFDRVDDDKELFFELIDMFFEDYDEVLSGLHDAISSGEDKQLEERAHAVKSALGNLGAMRSFHYAFALEQAGRAEEASGAEEICEKLKSTISAFQEEVEKIR